MKKCQFCGAELPDEASFCLQCSSVLNCREELNTKNPKVFLYKKAFAFCLVIFFIFTISIISVYRIKKLPLKPQNTNAPETVLVPVTEENGEAVTDSEGSTVYEAVTVEPTTKKPSFISAIISNFKDQDKDKDKSNDKNDNNVSNSGTTGSSSSGVNQKPTSTEKDTTNSSKEPSTNNNNVTAPTQNQAPTETETATEEEIIKENPAEVFEYTPYEKSTTQISITKYKGNSSSVTIPEYIDDLMVVEIAKNAFENNSKVKTIDVPHGKRKFLWLQDYCFNNCSSLLTVNFYDNDIGTFGNFAYKCPIKNVNTSYWQFKFVDGGLYYYTGSYWELRYFAGNPCYDTLTLQPWCARISSSNNIRYADNLKVIKIHKSIESIPDFSIHAEYPTSLQAFIVESGNPKYFSKDGVLFVIKDSVSSSSGNVLYPYSKKDKIFTFPQKENYTFRLKCFTHEMLNPYVEEMYLPLNTYLDWSPNSIALPNLKKLHYAKGHSSYEDMKRKFIGEIDLY